MGTTDFREVAEYIDDDSDEETEVKELGECSANPLTEVPCMGTGELRTAPKEGLEDEDSVKAPRLTGKPVEPQKTQYYDLSPPRKTMKRNLLKH